MKPDLIISGASGFIGEDRKNKRYDWLELAVAMASFDEQGVLVIDQLYGYRINSRMVGLDLQLAGLVIPFPGLVHLSRFDLQAQRKLAREEASEVLENLQQQGYHLQLRDDVLIEQMLALKGLN